jgi:hypothetical protein
MIVLAGSVRRLTFGSAKAKIAAIFTPNLPIVPIHSYLVPDMGRVEPDPITIGSVDDHPV